MGEIGVKSPRVRKDEQTLPFQSCNAVSLCWVYGCILLHRNSDCYWRFWIAMKVRSNRQSPSMAEAIECLCNLHWSVSWSNRSAKRRSPAPSWTFSAAGLEHQITWTCSMLPTEGLHMESTQMGNSVLCMYPNFSHFCIFGEMHVTWDMHPAKLLIFSSESESFLTRLVSLRAGNSTTPGACTDKWPSGIVWKYEAWTGLLGETGESIWVTLLGTRKRWMFTLHSRTLGGEICLVARLMTFCKPVDCSGFETRNAARWFALAPGTGQCELGQWYMYWRLRRHCGHRAAKYKCGSGKMWLCLLCSMVWENWAQLEMDSRIFKPRLGSFSAKSL